MGRASLAICERLAKADPDNVQWQIDVAISCSKLGAYVALTTDERRAHLRRGLDILRGLEASGRLPPSQNWIGWFNDKLAALDADE